MIIQTKSFISFFFAAVLAMAIAGYAGSQFTKQFFTQKTKTKVAAIKPTTTPKPTQITHPTPTPSATPTPSLIPTISPIYFPLPTTQPTIRPDTQAPITSIYYPADGGSIDYKTDGKVCAYEAPPQDDSGGQGIESFFKFDDKAWKQGLGYFCEDSLPNGPHTLYFYSKDQSGNIEDTKSITFTVNIPGN